MKTNYNTIAVSSLSLLGLTMLFGIILSSNVVSADDNTFSFNASRFTQEELGNKAHEHELTTCGSTVLCIDHRMAGLGSASCGPELQKEYRIDEDSYSFAFMIFPENLNKQAGQ